MHRAHPAGIIFLVLALFCGLGRNFVFLKGFADYPPAFWFLALQPPILFWLQMAGSIFMLAGFMLIHRNLHGRMVSL